MFKFNINKTNISSVSNGFCALKKNYLIIYSLHSLKYLQRITMKDEMVFHNLIQYVYYVFLKWNIIYFQLWELY